MYVSCVDRGLIESFEICPFGDFLKISLCSKVYDIIRFRVEICAKPCGRMHTLEYALKVLILLRVLASMHTTSYACKKNISSFEYTTNPCRKLARLQFSPSQAGTIFSIAVWTQKEDSLKP